MPAKYCIKCGRAVNQNYCPQCGSTKFSTSQQGAADACESCGRETDRTWICAACKRKVCDTCVRSYKYLTTLCTQCYKIQSATSGVFAKPEGQEAAREGAAQEQNAQGQAAPGPEHEESGIEVIGQDENLGIFQKIKTALGGIFK